MNSTCTPSDTFEQLIATLKKDHGEMDVMSFQVMRKWGPGWLKGYSGYQHVHFSRSLLT